jgi:hypothetical protein
MGRVIADVSIAFSEHQSENALRGFLTVSIWVLFLQLRSVRTGNRFWNQKIAGTVAYPYTGILKSFMLL